MEIQSKKMNCGCLYCNDVTEIPTSDTNCCETGCLEPNTMEMILTTKTFKKTGGYSPLLHIREDGFVDGPPVVINNNLSPHIFNTASGLHDFIMNPPHQHVSIQHTSK